MGQVSTQNTNKELAETKHLLLNSEVRKWTPEQKAILEEAWKNNLELDADKQYIAKEIIDIFQDEYMTPEEKIDIIVSFLLTQRESSMLYILSNPKLADVMRKQADENIAEIGNEFFRNDMDR